MAQIELEKWVSTENIARYRDLLSGPTHEARHNQIEGLLVRELTLDDVVKYTPVIGAIA